MSKYKGIRFCDKCFKSISVGDLYYEDGIKKDKCRICNKKGSFFKNVVAILVFGVCLLGGYKGYTDVDFRVGLNTDMVQEVTRYTIRLDEKVQNTFKLVGSWADTVEDRLDGFKAQNEEESQILKNTLDTLRKETLEILKAQEKLKSDLGNGKMTEEVVSQAISSLTARAEATEEQLQILLRNPIEIIDKVVKPTVGISVRDKTGDKLRGSGVLFKKEQFVDESTGQTMYRYYGFTAYHVWDGIFQYLENCKKPDPEPIILPDGTVIEIPKLDRTLNPKLLIHYYGGNSKRATLIISNAEFLFPNAKLEKFNNQQDIAVFSFVHAQGDIAVAQLASDEEISANVFYGSHIYTTGIALQGLPSLYFGTVSNPKMSGDSGSAFQAFGFYGQSGGPLFDARTLKIISINQRIFVHNTMMSSSPVTNVIFGVLLKDIRSLWKKSVPAEHRNLLDP